MRSLFLVAAMMTGAVHAQQGSGIGYPTESKLKPGQLESFRAQFNCK
jgi:hypothetical protein